MLGPVFTVQPATRAIVQNATDASAQILVEGLHRMSRMKRVLLFWSVWEKCASLHVLHAACHHSPLADAARPEWPPTTAAGTRAMPRDRRLGVPTAAIRLNVSGTLLDGRKASVAEKPV
mgnify:CR=1 FL=1